MEWRNPRPSSSGASVPPPNPRRTPVNAGAAMNSNNPHNAQHNWTRSSAALLLHPALSQANLHRERARLDSGVSKDLHDLLDELAKLSYPLEGIEPLSPPQVLLASAQIMYLSDDLLVTKAADVIFVLCAKQKPDFSTAQGRSILEKLLETFLDNLSGAKQHVKVDLLRALSAVVFENGVHCQPLHTRLLDSLLPLASLSQPAIEIRRMAINSLGNLCTKAGKALPVSQLDIVFKTLVRNLDLKDTGKSVLEVQAEKRVVSSTFRSLQLVVIEKKALSAEQIESLLELSKKHILPDKKPGSQHPEADSSRPSSQPRPGGFPSRRTRGGQSDSDFSDGSDSGFGGGSQQLNEMKAKQNALLCIQHAVKASQKHAFALWGDYIPDSPSPKKASLFSLMKDSPSPKLRSTAAGTFCSFIEGSKQYLSMADDSGTAGTFLSLSRKLGNTVSLMHQELLEALACETDPTNVALLLKVLSVLVSNCAYQKLKGHYLAPIVMSLVPRLHHSELIIRTASLSTLEVIFSVTPALNELRLGLQTSVSPQPHLSKDKHPVPSPVQTLWSLATSDPSPQIRSGSLDCLAAIFRVYGSLEETQDSLLMRLRGLLRDRDPLVRTSSTKLLCDFARSLRDWKKPQECALLLQALFRDKVISSLVTDPNSGTRVAVTEIASLLTDDVHTYMDDAVFREAASLPFLLVSDETPSVRVAATKALGIVCLLSIHKEDLAFVGKFTQTLRPRLLVDQNVNVRVWASWALANLCDSLVLQKKSREGGTVHPILGHEVLSNLASLVLEASEENEKLRTNCVRCVGDLLRCLEDRTDQKLLQALISFLTSSMASSNAKIKWNACHASGNSFHNPVVLEHQAAAACFDGLISALSEEPLNFKVRINAVSALMTPSHRDHYGPVLVVAFRAIREALLGLDGINCNGFIDGKYKMQYEYQLQLCLLYLCSLLTEDDAGLLRPCLQDAPFFASLMTAIQRHSDLPPKAEKGGNLPIQAGPDPGASLLLSPEDGEGDGSSAVSKGSLLLLGARNLLDLDAKLLFFAGSESAASLLAPFASQPSPEGAD